MLEHLTLMVGGVIQVPVVFDPEDSYESTLKQFRTQIDEKYKHQGHKPTETTPSILSWRRSSLRRNPDLSRRAKPIQYILKLERDGSFSGDTVKVVELLGEIDLYFTLYTRDVEFLEDFEIKYLSGHGPTNFRIVKGSLLDHDGTADLTKFRIKDSNLEWESRIDWSNELSDPMFSRSDNSYSAISFQAKLQGSFFSVIEGGVTPKAIYTIDYDAEMC